MDRAPVDHTYDGLQTDGWRMVYNNPSQDQIRQYISIIKSKYSLKTDLVWTAKDGSVQSCVNFFPDDAGNLGKQPVIDPVLDLTDAQLASPGGKILQDKWREDYKDFRARTQHVLTRGTNITTLINNTMSTGMKQLLLSDAAGRAAMNKLEDPLTLINLIMTADFTTNTLNAKSDLQKYFNAKMDFNNMVQKMGETSTAFSIRFKTEYSKLKLLAVTAGVDKQLPNDEVLSFEFLHKLTSKYNELREEYDKGIKIKPATIDLLLVDTRFYDTAMVKKVMETSLVTKRTNSGQEFKGKLKRYNSSKPNVNPNNYRCIKHRTSEHCSKDQVCRDQDRKITMSMKAKSDSSKKV
jgi:hypothetical protein